MSTRSGKRIHLSFHDNTVKSEPDITRSERKTRSKHTKENLDELGPKLKKRNYVAYPSSADDEAGVDTVDCKDEARAARVLRKNALKECNFTSSTESVDPTKDSKLSADTRKSMRSTRRTRKFTENAEDNLEVIPQDRETSKIRLSKLPKPKKQKNKKAEQDQATKIEGTVSKKKKTEVTENMVVLKKKSKKKKGRRSSSIVVENIEPEVPSSLNKSNMSADSFHSAAGSPHNKDNYDESAPILQNNTEEVVNMNTSFENINTTGTRKTRSSIKLDSTLIDENIVEKEPRKKKSSIKVNLNQECATFEKDKALVRELRKRKSSINNEAIASSEDTEEGDGKNSTFNMEEKLNLSSRKSIRNATFDKTITPNKIDTTFDKDDTKVTSTKGMKIKHIVETFDVNEDLKSMVEEDSVNTTFEKDDFIESAHKGKKRKSAVNAMIKITNKLSPLNSSKKKSIIDNIFENDLEVDVSKEKSTDATFDCVNSTIKASPVKLSTEKAKKPIVDITFEKDSESSSELETEGHKKSISNATFDLTSSPFKSANEVLSPMKEIDFIKRNSVIDTTYEKDSDKDQETNKQKSSINTTFDKDSMTTVEMPQPLKADTEINCTFDIDQEKKLNTTFDKNSKSSLTSTDSSMITLDRSNASRISITSDESKNEENILNTTPVLIESSLDESQINTTKTKEITPQKTEIVEPITPLKREGTFTKDEPETIASPKPKGSSSSSLSRTPTKRLSLPSPGFTPFHVNKSSSKEKSVLLNITRSIEKRRSSLLEPPRTTKVMFCSPVNNPAVLTQNRRKVIKSNLKGSNKSFVFDDSVSIETRPSNRKRSLTQNDAEDARVKRKRLADDLQQSVDRLSRPRTSSASAKLAEPTTPSKKPTTPKKSDAKLSRTRLPNFAALHQRQFDRMESLDECQERRAKRAKQLLTPTGAVNVLDRISPKDKPAEPEKPKETPKPETPIKSLPTFKSLNPGYTRFGFKLNLDINPFSIPSKTQPKTKENKPKGIIRQATLPSLAGATSVRRAAAKQTVLREKSFTDRRNVTRTENRTVIKGVRTNRRFELQMRMRDI